MIISTRFCPICGAANELAQTNCFACGHHLATETQEETLRERYQLRATLGHGGYSVVYRARDLESGRDVAIKRVTLLGLSAEETIEATDTFNRELNLLDALHHPQVPRLYDHFSDRDHWYLVLEYLEGTTLETYLNARTGQGKPVQLEEGLAIGSQLCVVLEYLHTRQPPVIFRDLKPGNIIRSPQGKLSLIDFGIARYYRKGQERDTRNLGSPGYASPEQYGSAQTTPQSDLYSLGALLHALLSGQDPAEQPRGQGLVPLHLEDSAAGSKLAELTRRLLAPEPRQRPANVGEVAGELEAIRQLLQRLDASRIWQPPEPVQLLSPDGQQQQVQQFQRQFQAQILARKNATRRKFIKRGLFGIASVAVGSTVIGYGLPGLYSLLSNDGHFGRRFYNNPGSGAFGPPTEGNYVSQIAWSPNGQQAALISNNSSLNIVLGPGGGKNITFGGPSPSVLAWAPDSRSIALGFEDGSIMLMDMNPRAFLAYNGPVGPVENIAWSPNGSFIASADPQELVRICQADDGSLVARYTGTSINTAPLLTWSPDSTRLVIQTSASAAQNMQNSQPMLQVWSVQAGTLYTFANTATAMLVATWSPDGTRIATVDQDTLYLWDASNGNYITSYQVRNTPYLTLFTIDLVWSPDSNYIALDTGYSTLQVWDLQNHSSVLASIRLDVTRTMIWLPNGRIAMLDDNLKTEYIEP